MIAAHACERRPCGNEVSQAYRALAQPSTDNGASITREGFRATCSIAIGLGRVLTKNTNVFGEAKSDVAEVSRPAIRSAVTLAAALRVGDRDQLAI